MVGWGSGEGEEKKEYLVCFSNYTVKKNWLWMLFHVPGGECYWQAHTSFLCAQSLYLWLHQNTQGSPRWPEQRTRWGGGGVMFTVQYMSPLSTHTHTHSLADTLAPSFLNPRDWEKELHRLGVTNDQWRVTEANKRFQLCDRYRPTSVLWCRVCEVASNSTSVV